ncbi:MAG TPA: substrate-binding domain-containing protein [Polyangia bacterium]|jgi:molybdate/tungstate transport system substrate-binding protein
MRRAAHSGILALGLWAAAGAGGCDRRAEIVVFHAASLRRAFSDAAAALEAADPRVRVRLEPSGSQVAARKVSELGLRADVVAVADAGIVDRMLVPDHAAFAVDFATNELVLAHRDHSRYTDAITTGSFAEVLARPDVRLGCVDRDLAPIGYHTRLAWRLCERALGAAGAGLEARLVARCAREHVAPDETELLALLESRAVDYAFVYRSTAEDHHLKITALPDACSLGRRELAASYAAAEVEVRMRQGAGPTRVRGGPITYGLTIPKDAPNPAGARRFVALLLGASGRQTLERSGFRPLVPAAARGALPGELAGLAVVAR